MRDAMFAIMLNTKRRNEMMKHCVVLLLLVLVVIMFNEAKGASPADDREPQRILKNVQDKVNQAKTLSVVMQEDKGGLKIETACTIRQFGKGVISCRQEQRAVVSGATPQPFVAITDHNKLYFFPTGCGNVVVRMKHLESREPDSPLANLFFNEGTFERISENDADCSIRYTCTPVEVKALKVAIEKKTGVEFQKDMIPAVLEYKISKKAMTLSETTVYSERGKLISKQSFKDWQFDIEIPDSTFEIPKGFKQYIVKTAKDAEKLQVELMKVALAEQAKKQKQEKK